jgi:hypothetical protein
MILESLLLLHNILFQNVAILYLYLYPMKFCQLRHTSLIGVIKHNVTISQLSIQSSTKVFTRHMLFTWNKMLCNNNKLSSIMYRLMFKLHQCNPIHFKWITYVKSIFDECGLSFIWNDQTHMNRNVLKSVLKQKLLDQYILHWFQQINSSSRGEFYGIFKTEFKLEPYLIRLHP